MKRLIHATPIFNRDGFNHPADGWYMIEPMGEHPNKRAGVVQIIDKEACESIVNRFNTSADADPQWAGMLVDHEHFSDFDDQETRAYGWLMRLQNRADGIYAQIKWTTTGTESVDGGDYRFFSTEYAPEDLKVLNDGKPAQVRPMKLDGLTLTNKPNNKGGKPITNRKPMKRILNDDNDDAGTGDDAVMNSSNLSEAANAKTTKARAASATATDTGDKEDHLKAATANTLASRAHAKAGDAADDADKEETARDHYESASDHASTASEHLDACADGCNDKMKNRILNGDYPGHPFHGNQHTGGDGATKQSEASRKANAASKDAKGGGAKEHAKAAVAHDKAAKAQEKAGNDDAAGYHKSMASYHMKQSAKGGNIDFKERKEKKGASNREEFRRDDTADNQNKGQQMKSVCKLLGLSVDASEESVLDAVTALRNRATEVDAATAPLRIENTALKAENLKFVNEQIEADLDAHGVRDEKLRNRFTAIIKPLANRKERLECLADIAPKGRSVSGQQKLHNRETKPPTDAETAGNGATGAAAIDDKTAQRISNRASAIMREKPGTNQMTAFTLARNEIVEA